MSPAGVLNTIPCPGAHTNDPPGGTDVLPMAEAPEPAVVMTGEKPMSGPLNRVVVGLPVLTSTCGSGCVRRNLWTLEPATRVPALAALILVTVMELVTVVAPPDQEVTVAEKACIVLVLDAGLKKDTKLFAATTPGVSTRV